MSREDILQSVPLRSLPSAAAPRISVAEEDSDGEDHDTRRRADDTVAAAARAVAQAAEEVTETEAEQPPEMP
eukprot:1810680-Lingulodinium_polyedra.AAC.1